MPPPRARAGRGCSSGCARGWGARRCTALPRSPTIAPSMPGAVSSRANGIRGSSTSPGRAPRGSSSGRAAWPRVTCACLPAPSASRRAGGAATTLDATTSLRRWTTAWRGSIERKANGFCMVSLPEYAELHCLSNFSFLRGASHPEELVARAAALGYRALALTDECSLAGAVRAHQAAKELGLQLILGSEVSVEKDKLVLLATDRRAYGAISSLITAGRRRSPKGRYSLSRTDCEALRGSGVLAL